eukprot:TRINITY_DN30802_c0_g1_i1.p1 TRINITY_DN30802_c0_g1~~TRINITY_DN30802_c0_g1_i1.p1  ORF type:complete len:386 (+),score=63.72 TRINITY_DN30802_c0_g1_i1:99-1160(+)
MFDEQRVAMYIIWLVRVLLPIVLFFFWYRSQANGSGDGGPSYNREEMLMVRKLCEEHHGPSSLGNMKLMEETDLQKLGFGFAHRNSGNSRRESGGGGKGGWKRGEKGGHKGSSEGRSGGATRDIANDTRNQAALSSPPTDDQMLSEEDRMHLESLLNFVAYSHKERPQRVFLPDKERPPPPPLPQKKLPPSTSANGASDADSAGALKANAEAQMVLKGVVNPKFKLQCPKIAHDLYTQLQESNVSASKETFSLMVEAFINASDLKSASDFLMLMETAGFCPGNNLLDKVMALYSETRAKDASKSPVQEDDPQKGDGAMPAADEGDNCTWMFNRPATGSPADTSFSGSAAQRRD